MSKGSRSALNSLLTGMVVGSVTAWFFGWDNYHRMIAMVLCAGLISLLVIEKAVIDTLVKSKKEENPNSLSKIDTIKSEGCGCNCKC